MKILVSAVIKRKQKLSSSGVGLICLTLTLFSKRVESKGTEIEVSQETREGFYTPPIITPPKRNKPPTLPCGASKSLEAADEYFIESPGFRKMKYPNNAFCNWHFEANECKMGITCSDFQLTDFLCFDHLDIVDHNGTMVRFCGNKGPKETILSDNVTISFRSSAWFPDVGFRCRVVCRETTVLEESPFPKPKAEPTSCLCGKQVGKIVGGKPAEITNFPWQAGLVRKGGKTPFCGGSLINSKYVLSAGHCVQGRTPYNLEIVFNVTEVGEAGAHEMEVRRSVETIIIHKKFTSRLDYDAALIRLSEPVDISGVSGSFIIPVCLPTEDDLSKTFVGENATLTGWGLTSEDGTVSPKLLQTDVEVISNEKCREFYPSVTDRMLCAHTPGKDACQGDSGGPLVISVGEKKPEVQILESDNATILRSVQVGIVSWGQGCGVKPGVYTRITEIMKWIATNAKDGSYCST